MKKLTTFDYVCAAVILVGVIGGFLFPATGRLVLLDELCGGLTVLGAGIWFIKPAIMARRSGKSLFLPCALAAVLMIVSIMITKDAVLDLAVGSATVTLTDCSVETRGSSRGITSLDYYLVGKADEDTTCRFEISGKDYERLKHKNTVVVTGYLNSGRIITYQ